VIVVIGQPILGRVDGEPVPTGSAARIALAAASSGGSVQLVGKVGEDADGEALVLALAQGHVGHVAVLRDPAHATPREVSSDGDAADAPDNERIATNQSERPALDAADVELALRYLTEFRVVVLADDLDEPAVRVVADAAGWSNATLIALIPEGRAEPTELPPDAIVLGAPAADADGAFDRLVGGLAAAIDAGADPRVAFRELVTGAGWEPAAT
jgi:sugar/nucleoside kinase (ribokinase family)